jgi:PAS domain S-box-containing protein
MRAAAQGIETENLFEILANKSPVGLYIIQDGEFRYTNPTFQNTTGYSEDELLGRDSLELIVPEDKEMVRDNAIKMLKGELTIPYQFRVTHKNGSIKWITESVVTIRYRGRRATLGYFVDTTERKHAEETIQVERNKLQSLINAMRDALNIVDRDYNLIFQNEPAKRPYGDRTGEKCYLAFEGNKKVCDGCPVEKAFRDGQSHTAERETEMPSGKVIFWENTANPIKDAEGRIVSCLEIAKDITERKKQEQALKDSEESYRTLADSITDVFFAMDEHLRYTYWNKASEILTGIRADDALGKSLLEIFPDTPGTKRAEKVYRDVLRMQQPQTFVNDYDINGRHYIFEISAYPSRCGISVFVRDITERKKTEEALNLQRTYFQQLFNDSPDAIIMVDTNGKVILCNSGFETLFGYPAEEITGQCIRNFIVPDPQEAEQETANFYQMISSGAISRKEVVRRRKDGSLVDVSTLSYPIRFGNTVVGAYLVYSDITKRKEIDKKLERAAQEWRKTFDSISDAISIHDRDFRILRANRAFADMFHMKPSQIIGKHCYELHEGDKPISGCPHQQTLATGKPAAADFYESHLERYLRESTSPIFNEKGEVIGTVHIARDITEQKQQSARLMLADRLASLGELAAGTAHELNNPLTSVIGFSQLLMEKDIPDDVREDVKLICNEAQRAAGVTKNLLTFARKHAPVKQLTQINNVIEDVLKLRAYEQKVNSIEGKKRLAPDLPEIMVDYSQMQQVFINIIINAEYFMSLAHNKGTLTITTKKHNNSVMISIADDGPGIPEENLSRIFDPFFTTKEAGKGTGLGLSICHGIVAEHGGQIYAKSQLGKGATFVVELPIISP